MVEFLKRVRRKSLLSELLYYLLNIGLAGLLFVLTQTIQMPAIAIAIVLVSKWRIFAVRPRYWWTNLQANMVDIIVGVSIVILMYLPGISVIFQAVLAVIYAVWLIVIKPWSKRAQMLFQAFVAVFFGVTALYSIAYDWPVALVVLAMLAIGYSTARHFLYSHDEEQITLLSAIWALCIAEVGWLAYYWTFSYSVPGLAALRLPQITIIVMLMSFMAERLYRSWAKHKHIVSSEVMLPVIFSSLLIVVMLLFFNSVTI